MIKSALVDGKTQRAVHVENPYNGFHRIADDTNVLVTISPWQTHGVFRTVSITTQTTTAISTPLSSGSLLITDIVVSAKKVTNSTLDVRFDDGTNTAVIMSPDTNNAPANIAWSPQGRIQGWMNATLKVVTAGANPVATVTLGYMEVPSGLPYAEWDALR